MPQFDWLRKNNRRHGIRQQPPNALLLQFENNRQGKIHAKADTIRPRVRAYQNRFENLLTLSEAACRSNANVSTISGLVTGQACPHARLVHTRFGGERVATQPAAAQYGPASGDWALCTRWHRECSAARMRKQNRTPLPLRAAQRRVKIMALTYLRRQQTRKRVVRELSTLRFLTISYFSQLLLSFLFFLERVLTRRTLCANLT